MVNGPNIFQMLLVCFIRCPRKYLPRSFHLEGFKTSFFIPTFTADIRRCCGVLQVNVTMKYNMADVRTYMDTSSEWEMVMSGANRNIVSYSCCPAPYVDIEFQVQLRRRPTFASHLFVAPSVILCLITPTVFALPPASFEKLTLGE